MYLQKYQNESRRSDSTVEKSFLLLGSRAPGGGRRSIFRE